MTNKTCNKCLQTKDINNFFRDKTNKTDGHGSLCKICKTASHSKWREKTKDYYNEYMRKYRATDKIRFKNIDLKRTYGITLEDYNIMLSNQNQVCAICKNPPKGKRPLAVDHDHVTGAIRGLLCYGCNRALSILDNKGLLEAATNYLLKK